MNRKIKTGFRKSSIYATILALLVITFISCEDEEEYDYPDEYYIGRATLISTGEEDFIMHVDGDENEYIVTDYDGDSFPNENQRAFVKYSIIEKNDDSDLTRVDLLGIEDILTKDVVDMSPENTGQMGDDPVHLYQAWLAGGYLNINFGFNYGGEETHTVNLVKNTTQSYPDDGKVYLEFRHNAFNDPEDVACLGTVCFDMKTYDKEDGSEVTFVIKFHEFGVDSSYELKYDFTEDNTTFEPDDSDIMKVGYK